EDGIRDFHVTGVQTCALPIYLAYNKTNGLLYFISNSNNANEGKLHAIDPATGVVSLVGSQQTLLVFGAMYGDANGFIYGAANTGDRKSVVYGTRVGVDVRE